MARTATLNKSDSVSVVDLRGALLEWYDKHRRVLPWRALPGESADVYRVWLSEIMLQQTVVNAVKSYYERFLELWPTVFDLAGAQQEDVMREWAGLGYYSRARNLHKCAQIIAYEHDGVFPSDQKELKTLPGIGDYTRAAIMAIGYNKPAVVVDGNVERVISRLYALETPLPDVKKEIKKLVAPFYMDGCMRAGDLAQAFMDLGSSICTPKNPMCALCPLSSGCLASSTGPEKYPVRKPKEVKPERFGAAYIILDNNKVLLERRESRGLLGGMVGFPGTNWGAVPVSEGSSIGSIQHVFTHFKLSLDICVIEKSIEGDVFWVERQNVLDQGLPTVFKKVWLKFLEQN